MRLFDFSPQNLPAPAHIDRVQTGWERFIEAAQKKCEGDDNIVAFIEALKSNAAGAKLAASVFGNSPFLSACWLNDPLFTKELLEFGPDAARDGVLQATREGSKGLSEPELKRHLRIQKKRIALTAAVADISGAWGLFDVTGALSDFADAARAINVCTIATANQLYLIGRD